mmetsp:Transcript_20357/g.41091  ORF Transcript_20357/g.41091 Transcript_20357/m.41091 type:complete len:269 (+) Transcript_20357:272-1078(+)
MLGDCLERVKSALVRLRHRRTQSTHGHGPGSHLCDTHRSHGTSIPLVLVCNHLYVEVELLYAEQVHVPLGEVCRFLVEFKLGKLLFLSLKDLVVFHEREASYAHLLLLRLVVLKFEENRVASGEFIQWGLDVHRLLKLDMLVLDHVRLLSVLDGSYLLPISDNRHCYERVDVCGRVLQPNRLYDNGDGLASGLHTPRRWKQGVFNKIGNHILFGVRIDVHTRSNLYIHLHILSCEKTLDCLDDTFHFFCRGSALACRDGLHAFLNYSP